MGYNGFHSAKETCLIFNLNLVRFVHTSMSRLIGCTQRGPALPLASVPHVVGHVCTTICGYSGPGRQLLSSESVGALEAALAPHL